MTQLTNRQRQVRDFIERQYLATGMPLTVREIAGHFGVNINAVVGHLKRLERKGVIEREFSVARSIRPAQPSELRTALIKAMARIRELEREVARLTEVSKEA